MSNKTRWGSIYEMLQRYLKIKGLRPLLKMDEIDDLLLSSNDNDIVQLLYNRLKEFNEITVDLQSDDATFAKLRSHFDSVIEDYPFFSRKVLTQHL